MRTRQLIYQLQNNNNEGQLKSTGQSEGSKPPGTGQSDGSMGKGWVKGKGQKDWSMERAGYRDGSMGKGRVDEKGMGHRDGSKVRVKGSTHIWIIKILKRSLDDIGRLRPGHVNQFVRYYAT